MLPPAAMALLKSRHSPRRGPLHIAFINATVSMLRLLRCSMGIALNTMGLFHPIFSWLGVNLSDHKALSW